MRGRRWVTRLILGMTVPVLVAGLLAGPGAPSSSAVTCQAWSGQQPDPMPGTTDVRFHAVAVLSGCDVWAVGEAEFDSVSQGLIEHWTGDGSWTIAGTIDAGDTNFLYGISAASANDVWVVGAAEDSTAGTSTAVIAHWDGSAWTLVPSPSPSPQANSLNAVTAISATDAWAVGSFDSGGVFQTLTEHWDGSRWQQVPSPSPGTAGNELTGVTATSATSAWAVGSASSNGVSQALIEHWDGIAWRTAGSVSPGTEGNSLASVTAISASNVWAVGSYKNDALGLKTLVEHWNGSSWTRTPSADPDPNSNELLSVSAASATDVWAVGVSAQFTGFPQALTEHWDGTSWQPVTSPDPGQSNYLLGVGSSSTGITWAVGGSDGQALVTSMVTAPPSPPPTPTPTPTPTPAPSPTPTPTSAAVPALAGDTRAQAAQQLQAAGLVLGAVQTVVDPTCDNIGTVLNQSPAAGGHVSLGTAVSITLGRAPRLCD